MNGLNDAEKGGDSQFTSTRPEKRDIQTLKYDDSNFETKLIEPPASEIPPLSTIEQHIQLQQDQADDNYDDYDNTNRESATNRNKSES